MHDIVDFLNSKNPFIKKASSSSDQLDYLRRIASAKNIRTIAEIGFNSGFSSYAFLEANPRATVTSFDIGRHKYVRKAKKFIDRRFPRRHSLIIGDSRRTVPEFIAKNTAITFDLIFIDGGHSYWVAKKDLKYMRSLAHKDTILIMDDIAPWLPWGVGPTKAWREMKKKRLVVQDELLKDGRIVNRIRPPGIRVLARGRYLLDN